MTPLHSGSPTYDGVMVIPSHFTSLIHASAMYCGPQSQRIRSPRATSFAKRPNTWRTPWRSGSSAAQRSPILRGVPAHELVDAVIDGAEEPAPAIRFGVEARRVGAPHLIRVRGGD